MITSKEKAEELVQKMKLATDEFGYININIERHKQCALIAVDEIISYCCADDVLFLHKVKEEIEKL